MADEQNRDIYTPPDAELGAEAGLGQEEYFSVSIRKLIVMYAITLGGYSLVYFYQNWKLQKLRHGLNVIPVLRAIFAIFFTHSLFSRIRASAEERSIEGTSGFSGLATLYVVCTLLSSINVNLGPTSQLVYVMLNLAGIVLPLVALYPLVVVQRVVQQINHDEAGELNSQFTVYNWIFILLGAFMWVSILLGIYMLMFGELPVQ